MKWMVMQSGLEEAVQENTARLGVPDPRTSSEKRKLLQRDNLTTGRD
uniref:Uncharacterized protein n=1 Tax=Anguilla anguilla TaxID=7936 RepID=A0A0E9PQM4_ANGAN